MAMAMVDEDVDNEMMVLDDSMDGPHAPSVYKDDHARIHRTKKGVGPKFKIASLKSLPPLWQACGEGNENKVMALVQQGHSVNSETYLFERCMTPLFAAITKDQNEIITLLHSMGVDLNHQNVDHTPLMWACHFNLQTVQQLLMFGADVFQKNCDGETALHIAVEIENVPIVRLLLKEAPGLINMTDMYGEEALSFSCNYGDSHPELVRILLEYGADVNNYDVDEYQTPLHAAAVAGNREVMELLLETNASVNATDINALTPLHLAMINVQTEMVDMLNAAGAEPYVVHEDGETALFYACRYDNVQFFDLLIPNIPTSEIYRRCNKDLLPLDVAVLHENLEIASKLRWIMQQRTQLRGIGGLLADNAFSK